MLQTLLAEGRPLLADGATGTNLFAMGLVSGETPERWNAEHPDQIRALHQSFVDAGSDIILTNSFGGNRRRLMLHNLQDRAHELNKLAAEIARSVADKAGRKVVVAGSVGPTGDLLAPLGPLTEDEAVEVFVEQIEGLKAGGADVVWIETMSATEEIRAAARAAASARNALHRHGQLRHGGTHDDGRRARGARRDRRGFRSEAARLRRELRRRRLGPPGRHPRDERSRPEGHLDRQGQCGRAALAWRGDPLFRHPGAHGDLCAASRSIAGRGSSAAAAATRPAMSRRCGAGSMRTSPAHVRRWKRSSRRSGRSSPRPRRSRPAAAARGGGSAREQQGEAARLEAGLRGRRAGGRADARARSARPADDARGRAGLRGGRFGRRRAARPFPRPQRGRTAACALAHASQGADRGGRGDGRRRNRPRPRGEALRGRGDPVRGAAAGGFSGRRPGYCAQRRVRGRASDRDRQAGGARRPSGARATRKERWSMR